MKKIYKVFLCLALIFCTFSFVACGGDNNNNSQPPSTNPPADPPPAIETRLSELDILADVYKDVNEYFTSNPPVREEIVQQYNKYIAVELGLIGAISNLSGIDKVGWYSDSAVEAAAGEANKLELFGISTHTFGGSTSITCKLLFSKNGDDIRAQYARGYVYFCIDVEYDQDTKSFKRLIVNYENSSYIDKGKNLYSADNVYFEIDRINSGFIYDYVIFNRDDSIDSVYNASEASNIVAYRGHINSYLNYSSEIDFIKVCPTESSVRDETQNSEIVMMLSSANNAYDDIASMLQVGSDSITAKAGFTQSLAKYANAKSKSDL